MSDRNVTYYLFGVVRVLLYPLALLYGAIVWLRNKLYDSKFFSSIKFSIPVVSVGNLSVGGTGKTPHIEYLIRLLQYEYRIATMSRGYKRRTQGFLLADDSANALRIGDEPMQYKMKFPEVAVSVAEERMTGIPALLQKRPELDVVLLDDAYQHRSVRPGLNILITDFSKPFYTDHVLPYGSLRESRKAYQRADVILVSKCPPNLSTQAAADIRSQIAPLLHQQVFFTTIVYGQPYELMTGTPYSLEGKHAVLVCCIAKPEPLVKEVKHRAQGVHILSYPDHHYFLSRDMDEIEAAFQNWQVADKVIVTTEKDATRLHLQRERLVKLGAPVIVLPIQVAFLFGQGPMFDQRVIQYVDTDLADHREYYQVG